MRNKQLLQKIYEQQAEILHQYEDLEHKFELLEDHYEDLKRKYQLIETVLIVKEPGTQLAAESFEGLRKQIIAGQGERRSHLSKIVEIAVAVERGGGDDLGARVEEWLNAADIFRLNDLASVRSEESRFFELVDGRKLSPDEWSDPQLEVVEDAFIDGNTQRVLRAGRVEFVVASPQPEMLQPQAIAPGELLPDAPSATVSELVVSEASLDSEQKTTEPQPDLPSEQVAGRESAAEMDLVPRLEPTGKDLAGTATDGVTGGEDL